MQNIIEIIRPFGIELVFLWTFLMAVFLLYLTLLISKQTHPKLNGIRALNPLKPKSDIKAKFGKKENLTGLGAIVCGGFIFLTIYLLQQKNF